MGKFRVEVTKTALNDIEKHKKSGNTASLKKIVAIISELEKDPYTGIGNPEPLKYDLTGYWSRRINQKDRLVYKVDNNIVTVFVVSAMGHYSDK